MNSGCKTIKMKRRALSDFMFYRFLPIQEPYYDAVIVRNVDSILDERDEWTVEEWLESGCGFHIIEIIRIMRFISLEVCLVIDQKVKRLST